MIQLIENARKYTGRIALKCNEEKWNYEQLIQKSENIANQLIGDENDLKECRIAFLVDPGFDYVSIQWAIWLAGGIAVPLCTKHPLPSIQYVINDTQASIIIYSKNYKQLILSLELNIGQQSIPIEAFAENVFHKKALPNVSTERRALILYTSGTTGNPKGVVTTHHNIENQITALIDAWQWDKDDHILNVLPLHHVHGIINVLSCALWVGACNEFLVSFDEEKVFDVFKKKEVNLFMAVPTIYYKLINYFQNLPKMEQIEISAVLSNFRLMVSGSAALPISVLEKWKVLSNHTLLERYGMTEIGMAISNPYKGERKPGHIGQALKGVSIRLVDENNNAVQNGEVGEIQVKGPNVFQEYWQKPEATKDTFSNDGWFKTGDIAIFNKDSYKILGRNSVDIIKSGGYKISALEIEEVLRTYPGILECGVIGIPDEEWGEIIGACLITNGIILDIQQLNSWLREKLPNYKIPRKYIFQDDLPRNVMGKVTKKELLISFLED